MDAMEAILTRRSIRRYTDEDISAEQVETLLRAAMAAPSAIDNRDWAFVVVRDRQILADIASKEDGNAEMLKTAPVGIVVCGDMNLTIRSDPDYWIQDCSACVQNILLAAHATGLGAVWLGTYPVMNRVRGVAEVLGLPAHIVPLAVVSIGHPARRLPPADRFEPEKIHFEKW